MVSDYSYLQSNVQKLLLLNDEERISYLNSDHWIGYQKAEKIIMLLKDMVARPRKLRPECLLIIGESNIGKTTIVYEFIKKNYINSVMGKEEYIVDVKKPVLLLQAPAKPNVKDLLIGILNHFFAPYKASETEAKLRYQVIYLLRKFDTKMLIIDEIHNFLSGTPRQQQEVMNTLKFFSNELSLNIVGVGIKEATLILHTDAQYASRFDVVELPKWKIDVDFRRLLLSYIRLLPLKKYSDLASKEIASLLWEISEGNLGNLNRLIVESSKEAILSGKEEITVEIIKKYKWLKPTVGQRNLRIIEY